MGSLTLLMQYRRHTRRADLIYSVHVYLHVHVHVCILCIVHVYINRGYIEYDKWSSLMLAPIMTHSMVNCVVLLM